MHAVERTMCVICYWTKDPIGFYHSIDYSNILGKTSIMINK